MFLLITSIVTWLKKAAVKMLMEDGGLFRGFGASKAFNRKRCIINVRMIMETNG